MMLKRDFKAFFIPLAIWICAFLDFVSMVDPNTPPPPWAAYYKETKNADFGIRMKYDAAKDKAMTVIISYDTETTSASNFFKYQITAKLIDDFSACKVINWNFNPCTTTKFDNQGTLICKTNDQCSFDNIHGCIATGFNWHPDKMGKFLICFFAADKKTPDQYFKCAADGGLIKDDITECVNSGRGAQSCNYYHSLFEDARSKRTQSEAESTGKYPNAIVDLKSVTCQVLAQGSLSCPSVCNP